MCSTLRFLILRCVLGVLRIGPGPDDKDVEIAVLRHQLSILRRQVVRPRFSNADRAVLSSLAKLLTRDRWAVFLVTPATVMRWHRQLVRRHWTQPSQPPRPGLPDETVELVVRLGAENPRWGYMRIVGECAKLGVKVSATSVRNILRRRRLGSTPRRGPSWVEFLHSQASGVLACDFFHVDTVRLQRLCCSLSSSNAARCSWPASPPTRPDPGRCNRPAT